MALMRTPRALLGDEPTRAVVMLVDALPVQRRELADRLAAHRLWVIAPVDLAEADEILKAIRPSLVLIRDGSAQARMLANRVRADRHCAGVTILAMPASSTAAVEARVLGHIDGELGEVRPRRRQQ